MLLYYQSQGKRSIRFTIPVLTVWSSKYELRFRRLKNKKYEKRRSHAKPLRAQGNKDSTAGKTGRLSPEDDIMGSSLIRLCREVPPQATLRFYSVGALRKIL